MMLVTRFLVVVLFWLLGTQFGHAAEVLNGQNLRQLYRVEQQLSKASPDQIRKIKIAVLDNGFQGFKSKKDLPNSAVLVEKYPQVFLDAHRLGKTDEGNPPAPTNHGLVMAQTAWELSGKYAEGPKFYLLNSNGYTQFKRAVQYAIDQRVDFILYSQNWEYGGNFDGQGFINALVTKATDRKIIWVNAAGNDGGKIFSSHFKVEGGLVHMKNDVVAPAGFRSVKQNDSLYVTSELDDNPATLSLTWNGFSDDENRPTEQDLDIQVLDSENHVVAKGDLVQIDNGVARGAKSIHAREKIRVLLNRGTYRLRAVFKGGKSQGSFALKWIVQSERPEGALKLDRYSQVARGKGEVLIPADHAAVVTVGDASVQSNVGFTSDNRFKPDLWLENSRVEMSSGIQTEGSSNAAAMVVGMAALAKSVRGSFTAEDLKAMRVQAPGVACVSGMPAGFESRISPTLKNFFSSTTKNQNLNWFVEGNGRAVLELGMPIEALVPLYENVAPFLEQNKVTADELRYFASENFTRPQGVEGVFVFKKLGFTLPQDFMGPSGFFRWLEVVDFLDLRRTCEFQTKKFVLGL